MSVMRLVKSSSLILLFSDKQMGLILVTQPVIKIKVRCRCNGMCNNCNSLLLQHVFCV